MSSWRVRAIRLPDGDTLEDAWLDATGWRIEPVPGAEDLPGRFALTGLVDAHSHVSFGWRDGPVPLDQSGAQASLDRHALDGVAVVRDAGGDPAVVLAIRAAPGRPLLIAAGRHLAPPGLYFNAVHLPVQPGDLVDVALRELAAGARWVKLVADFSPARADAASNTGPPVQTYDLEVIRDLVGATHRAGGRVAAHATTTLVGDLVAAGIDSVEHGTEVDPSVVAQMAGRGTAWTPTLCAHLTLPQDAPPERRWIVAERRDRFRALLPMAIRLGVPILTGSDVVGSIPREVALLTDCGLAPIEALRAATTTAMDFLGLDPGEVAPSVVTYHDDPRDDPLVLGRPAAIVLGGKRVA
jgi:imidazolonepropionase-like amidohydrolase